MKAEGSKGRWGGVTGRAHKEDLIGTVMKYTGGSRGAEETGSQEEGWERGRTEEAAPETDVGTDRGRERDGADGRMEDGHMSGGRVGAQGGEVVGPTH